MQTNAPLRGEPLPVELMNTIWADRDGIHDALADHGEAAAWLRAIAPRAELDIPAAAPSSELIERLRTLRDALRRLAAETTKDPRAEATAKTTKLATAVGTVNAAAAATPRWSALRWDKQAPKRIIMTDANAGAALVSLIAEHAIELFAREQRHELRACLAPGCVLYFVKSHPRREWCSAACGNRARVARHYQRHHQPDGY